MDSRSGSAEHVLDPHHKFALLLHDGQHLGVVRVVLDLVGIADVVAGFVEGVFVTGRADLDHIHFFGVLHQVSGDYVVDNDLEGEDGQDSNKED